MALWKRLGELLAAISALTTDRLSNRGGLRSMGKSPLLLWVIMCGSGGRYGPISKNGFIVYLTFKADLPLLPFEPTPLVNLWSLSRALFWQWYTVCVVMVSIVARPTDDPLQQRFCHLAQYFAVLPVVLLGAVVRHHQVPVILFSHLWKFIWSIEFRTYTIYRAQRINGIYRV